MKEMNEEQVKEIEAEFLEMARIYIANDILVTRELFIKEISYVLYEGLFDDGTVVDALFTHMDVDTYLDGNILSIRNVINEMIHDTNEGTVVLNEKIFSSYLEIMNKPGEERPLKKYLVTHDVVVKPALQLGRPVTKWKRQHAVLEATSFANARKIFRDEFERLNPGRRIKRIKVSLYEPDEVVEVKPGDPEITEVD